VPLWKINPLMREAAVDIEDRRFFQHGGVNYLRLVNYDNFAPDVVQLTDAALRSPGF